MADNGPATITSPTAITNGAPATHASPAKAENNRTAASNIDGEASADEILTQSTAQPTSTPTNKGEISTDTEQTSAPTGLFARLKRAFGHAAQTDSNSQPVSADTPVTAVNAQHTRREMIERVIAFDEKRVFDVMIPRADIFAVDQSTSLANLIQEFSEAGHSRMPVFRGDLDNPQGMVHIKDLVSILATGDKPTTELRDSAAAVKKPVLADIVRKVLYVPPSMRVVDLFLRMQVSRIHMALVIDEYGGTDGLVTIEDLIEQIVGEINDEHDDDEGPLVRERKSGGWEADARIELKELETITGVTLCDDDEDFDTLGGLVFALAGRVPLRGEIINHPSGLEFEVTEADVRKIRKIRIRTADALKAAKIAQS